jgi:poly(ribitol-phosphate) beta-N-acetylglucosaminyltransferase
VATAPGGTVAVSVIVPVYNPGKFVEVCIESLIGQSLPREQYEVIFVDDGSTDETPERLDEVAAKESNVRVFHEPPSGWPGRPRNVGIDNAVGTYVYFCDHDDWLAPEALERMVGFADRAGADVLIGKMIGHRRSVPHALFRENDSNATLWTKPLMSSLSPHKLFRRSFLDEHKLRFPEGKRRLEDHVFVVQAYLLASTIAVLGDYACYHHIRRDDESNAAYGLVDPAAYVGYVREVIDIIEAHTEPGPKRDQVLERPFSQELLGRLTVPRRSGTTPPSYYQAMFNEVRALMLERFTPEFADRLALANRVRAAAVRDDRMDVLTDLNERVKTLRGRAVLRSLRWDNGQWHADLEAEAVFSDGTSLRFTPLGGDRWSVDPRLLPVDARQHEVTTAELLGARPSVIAVERATDDEWYLPATFTAELRDVGDDDGSTRRVVVTGTASLDPATLAGGRPLPNGVWDVSVRFATVGVDLRARIGVDTETPHPLPSAAIVGPRPVTIIPYLTETYEKLSFDVGQRIHTLLAALLARPVGSVAVTAETFAARVDVDIAPHASPRSLRLQLLAGDLVAGHSEATIVAEGDHAVLRGSAIPKPSAGGVRIEDGAGRYTLGAQSRARDKPSLMGVVDVDRRGQIIAADFDPAFREGVVPLPARYGVPPATQRINRRVRRLAHRLLRRGEQ